MRNYEQYPEPEAIDANERRTEHSSTIGTLALLTSIYFDPVGMAAEATHRALEPINLEEEIKLSQSA